MSPHIPRLFPQDAPQGIVAVNVVGLCGPVGRGAVVGGKDDDRVLHLASGDELLHDVAHGRVELCDVCKQDPVALREARIGVLEERAGHARGHH